MAGFLRLWVVLTAVLLCLVGSISGSLADHQAMAPAAPPSDGGAMAESRRTRADPAAGGDVVLGGFVVVMVVAVACYIRVTRKAARKHAMPDLA